MFRTIAGTVSMALTLLLVQGCTSDGGKKPEQGKAAQAAPTALAPQRAETSDVDDLEELYVDLEVEPDEGVPPLTVKFTSYVEDGTEPYVYEWDFGDGSPKSTEANPTHVYDKDGEYVVTIKITDSQGLWGTEEWDILVETEE